MDVSTVNSTASKSDNSENATSTTPTNNNNINTINNTTGQLIGNVIDGKHLQSHQQASTINNHNKNVINSFANNYDNLNNSINIQNYDNTNFPDKTYHESMNIILEQTKPDQLQQQLQQQQQQQQHQQQRSNWNDRELALCDDALVTEIYEILTQIVLRVNEELSRSDKLTSTENHNNDQVKLVEMTDDSVFDHAEILNNTREIIDTAQETLLLNKAKNEDENCMSSNSDDATGDLVIDSVQPLDQQEGSPEQNTTTAIQIEHKETSPKQPEPNETTSVQCDDIKLFEAQHDNPPLIREETQQDEELDDRRDDKAEDIITLKNLEVTPPPTAPEELIKDKDTTAEINESRREKRRRPDSSEATNPNDSIESTGRSKRQRRQTKLFQAGDVRTDYAPEGDDSLTLSPPTKTRTSKPSSRNRKKSNTTSSNSDVKHPIAQASVDPEQQIVKIYEKNDYLAIRNEDNSFYLCQLAEDVDVTRTFIRVRWLDIKEGEKYYFLTSDYDKIPQASIIMPVTFPDRPKQEKKGKQYFELEDDVRENIMERLKRSLNITVESSSTQESATDVSQLSNTQ